MTNNNVLILSAQEDYIEAAKLIKALCAEVDKSTEIIDLEDIRITPEGIANLPTGGNIYFITNHPSVYTIAAILKLHDYKVINSDFLIKQNSKLYIQEKLRIAGISVPDHGFILGKISKELRSQNIYLKSFEHTRFSRSFENPETLDKFFASLRDGSLYYQEENIKSPETKEYKLYSIFGKLIAPENMPFENEISKDISKIANELELDAFSVDVIINESKQQRWVIDVNPASSFFGSTSSREEFVKRLMV